MNFQTWLKEQISELEGKQLLRVAQLRLEETPGLLNFGSNDYLNLSRNERVRAAFSQAAQTYGFGSGSARLLCGTSENHELLETEAARFMDKQSATFFSSGYLANCAMLTAGRSRHDTIIADKSVHASIIDGARCSGAKLVRFVHNDPDSLEQMLRAARRDSACGRVVVVTESVFSMDGDLAPLGELVPLCERFGADCFIDEAHAFGVFGGGRGCAKDTNTESRIDLVSVTLSKAAGGYGGLIVGSKDVQPWLYSKARQFIFQTSLPPAVAAANLEALRVLQENSGLGKELLRRADAFRNTLVRSGFDCGASRSQIVPVMVRDVTKAKALSVRLMAEGIFVPFIRTPTVPAGSERLRFSITLAHSEEQLAEAAEKLVRAAVDIGAL